MYGWGGAGVVGARSGAGGSGADAAGIAMQKFQGY